jgi:hypothetical protein
VPFGCATDFFFASRFFVFENPGATLGISAPALNKPVPVEEYIFYLTGFIAVLLIYLWLDEYWLAKYVTYTTAVFFEIIKLWLASGRPAKHAFLGLKTHPKVVGC